ncbi:MAG: RrF2 family transcriptional regulator [Limisphaerales bacterium]
MKLTVKSDYAARAVLELARSAESSQAVRADSLAKAAGVSANYLVQILIELKSRGIVKSVRGKEGGYLLAKKPAEITLGDVLRCVHGEVFDTPALENEDCPAELRSAWESLQSAATKAADEVNFQKLVEEGAKEEMYYI